MIDYAGTFSDFSSFSIISFYLSSESAFARLPLIRSAILSIFSSKTMSGVFNITASLIFFGDEATLDYLLGYIVGAGDSLNREPRRNFVGL